MHAPSRTLTLRPRVTSPADSLRPTRAEIDLDALARNIAIVRSEAGPAKVLAVVKADAYGHGVVPVATRLEKEGVDGFGVALAEEGIELREAGVHAGILILNGGYSGAHDDVIEAGLTPVLYDLGEAAAFAHASRERRFGIHVEIDTGMSRLGVTMRELDGFLRGLAKHPALRIDGVMTHFSSADADDMATYEQLARFGDAVEKIKHAGHAPKVLHAANSAGLFRFESARLDMVRPGIALFGVSPSDDVTRPFVPAMRLCTQILAMRELEKGETVGYSGTYKTSRRTRVATVPIGYADGLFRSLSNKGAMLVREKRCPIIGNISMDLTTLDVTDVEGASIGDEVVVLGEQGAQNISADEVARAAGTISFEILTNVSRRVPRVYFESK